MFRTLVMFPASADQRQVDQILAQTAAAFRERPTLLRMTTNLGAVMGPSAKRGDVGSVFEADFEDLEGLLGALDAESFREVGEATEALDPVLLVFECREV